MEMQLKNRSALITGSTSGIGFAIAKGLAAEGANVTLTGRTQAAVDRALAQLRKDFPSVKADGVAADCATAVGAEQVFAHIKDVDILVNNLGIYERKPFFDIPDADWLRLFEVNVLSGVRFARLYAPAMAKRGWGRVIFVSSESGLSIPKEMIHYGMTKAAQLTVSRGLAIELADTGVTVAEFEMDFFVNFRPTSLLKRFVSAEEVANLAAYLCSPLASATTGAAMRVDGGVVNQIM